MSLIQNRNRLQLVAPKAIGSRSIPAVTLMLDGDEPGQEAATKISARLIHQMHVKIAPLVGGLQPDQLSPEHIKTLLGAI